MMMKKWAYLLLLCALPVATHAQVGSVDTVKVETHDSLQQVIGDLSQQLQQVENDKRNEAVWKKRSKYFYLTYGQNKLKANSQSLSSDFSLGLVSGRTYYLHKKPLGGMVKFGIDLNYTDINFAKYPDITRVPAANPDFDVEESGGLDLAPMQIDLGMGLGLSCTVNPVDHLKAALYFHVTPSYSMVLQDEELHSSYATFFNFGFQLSYKVISLAFEMRRSNPVKYDGLVLSALPQSGPTDFDDPFVDPFESISDKAKNTSYRIMFGFRF